MKVPMNGNITNNLIIRGKKIPDVFPHFLHLNTLGTQIQRIISS